MINSMAKILESIGTIGATTLFIFFLAAPSTTDEMVLPRNVLEEKSAEVSEKIDILALQLDSLKYLTERKEKNIQNLYRSIQPNKNLKFNQNNIKENK